MARQMSQFPSRDTSLLLCALTFFLSEASPIASPTVAIPEAIHTAAPIAEESLGNTTATAIIPKALPVPPSDITKAEPNSYTRFIIYDCETGTILPNDGPDNSSISADLDNSKERHTPEGRPTSRKRTIIGPDERLNLNQGWEDYFPYCAIGITHRGCTAFFVSPYHAITAAHCVLNSTSALRLSSPNVRRGQNCNVQGHTHQCTRVYVPTGYTNNDPGIWQPHDYALVVYDTPSPCYLSFGFTKKWSRTGVRILGYPSDKRREEGCDYNTMTLAYKCGESGYSGPYLNHQCDTVGGNSGAPIYVADFQEHPRAWQVVYGVHTATLRTRNRGVTIGKQLWYQLVTQIEEDGHTFFFLNRKYIMLHVCGE